MIEADPYRRIARVYDRVVEPFQSGVRRVALRVLPPIPGWRVLDVGCGTGTGLEPYLDAGCDGVGVDVSAAMLSRAERRLGGRAELHLTDGDRLPFQADSFDLAMASLVLHEVEASKRPVVLSEMARVVGPQGRMVVCDFGFSGRRGWKGHAMGLVSEALELASGHHDRFADFRATGGLPAVAAAAGCRIVTEKRLAGGNLAVFVLAA